MSHKRFDLKGNPCSNVPIYFFIVFIKIFIKYKLIDSIDIVHKFQVYDAYIIVMK